MGSGQWKINNRVLCFYGIAGHIGSDLVPESTVNPR